MNRSASIVFTLLLFLTLQPLGMLVMQQLDMAGVRNDLQAAISGAAFSSDKIHFTVAANEFSQNRSGKSEYWLGNRLVDLLEFHITGDSVSVTAISDEKETELIGNIVRLFQKGGCRSGQGSQPGNAFRLLLSNPFDYAPAPVLAILTPEPDASVQNFHTELVLSAQTASILKPPPRV